MRIILAMTSVCSTGPAHVFFHSEIWLRSPASQRREITKFEVLLRTPAYDTKRFLFSSKFQSFHAIWKRRQLVFILCSDWLEAILLSEIMWTCLLSWLPWLYDFLDYMKIEWKGLCTLLCGLISPFLLFSSTWSQFIDEMKTLEYKNAAMIGNPVADVTLNGINSGK